MSDILVFGISINMNSAASGATTATWGDTLVRGITVSSTIISPMSVRLPAVGVRKRI